MSDGLALLELDYRQGMLSAIVEFLAGLLYGTGETASASRLGRRLVVAVMVLMLGGLIALGAYFVLGYLGSN